MRGKPALIYNNLCCLDKLYHLQDPNYPLPLIECVRGCWAHDYTQRPTAKKIEDSFKSPNCLRLKNSYNIKNTTVHAVLVTKVIRGNVEEELIWVASRTNDGCKLVSYTFAEQEDSLFHKIIKLKKTIHPKLCVTVSNYTLSINHIAMSIAVQASEIKHTVHSIIALAQFVFPEIFTVYIIDD